MYRYAVRLEFRFKISPYYSHVTARLTKSQFFTILGLTKLVLVLNGSPIDAKIHHR